ncbi:erythromycin esterase family protein [Goodfellowiella coeruleoviolacea]|uniref:Erythromycin esterase homolog n=1 Tax=Goodfellowiella coeruleoviolacea TaxID=334858 RepID=A0AAE3KJS8_9PSEU|nr:erythromycin esterase family protein [Goodfellowiella coeruleoviolacea]MCP2168664.1 Erythromycin esterase homolog [Goodfellowiella coeruleoviolacea]
MSAAAVGSLGWRFGAEEADLGDALDRFLAARPVQPRVLGLGEPTHLFAAFPLLRNRVLRHLVERHGYRSIAIESDCVAGLVVNDHVTTGAGDLDEVVANGLSHGFRDEAANRELIAWLRAVNAARDPADHVRFHGFDAPIEMSHAASPRQALTALHDYLAAHLDPARVPHSIAAVDELVGDDNEWTNPEAGMDPTRSVGRSARARQLRVVSDDLIGVLAAEAPSLRAATSPAAYDRACLFARTAQGLLRYHAVMADPGTERVARMLATRDAMMADNLVAIAAAEAERGPTLVFAHNGHLQRHRTRWRNDVVDVRWWSAGALVAPRLGADYAVIGADFGVAPAVGLTDPGSDSLQGLLAESTEDGALYPADQLVEALGGRTDLVPRRDAAAEPRYIPLDVEALGGVDAIALVRDAGPAEH